MEFPQTRFLYVLDELTLLGTRDVYDIASQIQNRSMKVDWRDADRKLVLTRSKVEHTSWGKNEIGDDAGNKGRQEVKT